MSEVKQMTKNKSEDLIPDENDAIEYKNHNFPKEQLTWLLFESKKTAYSAIGAFFGMVSNQCIDSKEDFLDALERVLWQRQDTYDLLKTFDESNKKEDKGDFPTEVSSNYKDIKLSKAKQEEQKKNDALFNSEGISKTESFDVEVEL